MFVEYLVNLEETYYKKIEEISKKYDVDIIIDGYITRNKYSKKISYIIKLLKNKEIVDMHIGYDLDNMLPFMDRKLAFLLS